MLIKWGKVSSASGYEVYMSTKKSSGFKRIYRGAKTSYTKSSLKKGKNIILIKAYDNNNAPCGLLYSLRLDYPENKTDLLISDRKTMAQEPGGSTVVPAQELGKFGCSPWGWQTSPQPALTNCGEIDFAF